MRPIGTRQSSIASCGWLLCWLDSRTCLRRGEFPRNREIGVRLIEAEGAGPDASQQDICERGITLRDSFDYRFDRLADALPGAFRSRGRLTIPASESDGAREFSRQRIDLLFRMLGALDVSKLLGFFEFFSQLGEPTPLSDLGLLVEHLARVAQAGDMDPRLFEILSPPS